MWLRPHSGLRTPALYMSVLAKPQSGHRSRDVGERVGGIKTEPAMGESRLGAHSYVFQVEGDWWMYSKWKGIGGEQGACVVVTSMGEFPPTGFVCGKHLLITEL